MHDPKKTQEHLAKVGPLVFILTALLILGFFWWFVPA